MNVVKIKKLGCEVKIPTRATRDSAGYDIYANILEPIKISPHETAKVPTGFTTQLPEGTVALIYSRSGLSFKKSLVIAQGVGVIDSDYRGEWYILLHNDSNEDQYIEPGDRIAQVIFTNFLVTDFVVSDEVSETDRGDRGFGSTGK